MIPKEKEKEKNQIKWYKSIINEKIFFIFYINYYILIKIYLILGKVYILLLIKSYTSLLQALFLSVYLKKESKKEKNYIKNYINIFFFSDIIA